MQSESDRIAARVYRVDPESEPLTAVEYLRAQADFTQTWIDTDAARAMNPADVAVSKDLAAASLEVLAELDRLREVIRHYVLAIGRAPSNRDEQEIEQAARALADVATGASRG